MDSNRRMSQVKHHCAFKGPSPLAPDRAFPFVLGTDAQYDLHVSSNQIEPFLHL